MMFAAAAGYQWPFDLAIWSGVVFVVLVGLLVAAARKPLVEGMRRRQEAILNSLRQAEIALEEVRQIRQRHEEERERLARLAEELVAEAKRDAEVLRAERRQRTEAEIARIRQRFDRELALMKQKALHEIWDAATGVSTAVAERLIRSQLSDSDHRRLVEESLAALRQQVGGAA